MKIASVLLLVMIASAASSQELTWSESLNTAKSATFLSALEQEVLFELNKVRSDPSRYAEMYVRPVLDEFKGKLNVRQHVETQEGPAAVQDCLTHLMRMKGMNALEPDQDLARVAAGLTSAQSKTRQTGHTAPNGKTFEQRMRKLKFRRSGECISYGESSARGIVLSLLIDDGVPSRGHRNIVLDRNFTRAGVSAGTHRQYGEMCTIDFASAQ
jgi:uncharacterized protein YkwD